MLECVICKCWLYDEFIDLSQHYDVEYETLVCVDETYGDIAEWLAEAYG